MRGHFSIEWMAQSSQHNQTNYNQNLNHQNLNHQTQTQQPREPSGPAACGTEAESLPGFYSRTTTRPEASDQLQQDQGLDQDRFSLQHHSSHSHPGLEAGFSSGTEEETSGYESEGGRSLSPLAPNDCSVATTTTTTTTTLSSPPPSPPAGRRPRTAFTAEQIGSLERAFKRNAYLGTQDKAELCRKLSLSDKQIRNWFQNRRMKLKRSVQDALAQACQANVASQFVHCSSPLELQSFRPRPYPRYHAAAVAAAAVAVGSQEAAAPPAPPGSAYVHHGLHAAAPLDAFYQYYTPYPHYY